MFFFDLWFQNFAHVDAIKNGLAALGNHMPGFPWPSPRNIQDQVREMRGERCEKSWQQLVERAIDTYERERVHKYTHYLSFNSIKIKINPHYFYLVVKCSLCAHVYIWLTLG